MSMIIHKGTTPLRRETRKNHNDMLTVSSRQGVFIDDFDEGQMRLVYIEDDSVYLVCRKGSELFFTTGFDRDVEVAKKELVEGDEPVLKQYNTPSYDSGWINIQNNTLRKIEHNLGGELLRINAYFKRTSDSRIFYLNPSFVQTDYDDYSSGFHATNIDTAGIQFAQLNDKEIGFSVLNHCITIYGHTNEGVVQEVQNIDSGQLRILLYKTGASI